MSTIEHNATKVNQQPKVDRMNQFGQKLISCQFCEKWFQYSSQLKEHESIHTGEKPFKCETCGRDFRLSSQLTVHKKVHSGKPRNIGEKCDKNLKNNDRSHTTKKAAYL